jgi:protein-tyrosine phosphatase
MTIDLHFHLLPGIDDGPDTEAEALALAHAAVAAGTKTVVATPHVSWRYQNDTSSIQPALDKLRRRLRESDSPLEVLGGAEIALTRVADVPPSELGALAIGRGPWLLLEPPFTQSWTGLETVVQRLQQDGHRVLVAHPERCPAFRRDPGALAALVRDGALTSITAGALVGDFGQEIRSFALMLVREGLAHSVASDAHDLVKRRPGILAKLSEAGLEPLADWLAVGVPQAIIDGTSIPPRPNVSLPSAPHQRRSRRKSSPWPFKRAS